MEKELGYKLYFDDVKEKVKKNLAQVFGMELVGYFALF
jgi:hypothetical protein